MADYDALRAKFVELMTIDGPTNDRRRREFNQAIFDADTGSTVWEPTTGYLEMVMDKFDMAVKRMEQT